VIPVSILLSTYNGARYLPDQLRSLVAQTHTAWTLYVRDDGSSDTTLALLRDFAARDARVRIVDEGSGNLRPAGSFARLMELRREDEYILFCDQDDAWLPEKIEWTLARLRALESQHGRDTPLLVHTDLRLANDELEVYAASMKAFMGFDDERGSTLPRLLAQNVVTGCTMLANRALIQAALPMPAAALMHDGWLALVAAALGRVDYLPRATLLYRQHGLNASQGARRRGALEGAVEISRQPEAFEGLMRRRFAQSQALEAHLAAKFPGTPASEFLQELHAAFRANRVRGIACALSHGMLMQGLARTAAYYALLLRANPLQQPSPRR
jgi:glycosyltransferase involved in cell wall biosynthesis